MHGKILGYGDGQGVILTEAGERFPFAETSWKELESPQRGQLVDFVVADGRAEDVYIALGSVRPAAASSAPGGATTRQIMADSAALGGDINRTLKAAAERDDVLGQVVSRVRAMPQILLAAIILFAAVAMTFLSIGYEHKVLQEFGYAALPTPVSLIGIGGETEAIREAIELKHEEISKMLDQLDTQAQSDLGRSADAMKARAALNEVAVAMGKLERLLGLGWIAWAIPALCVAVIGFGWMRYAAARPVGIVLGAISIAVAGYPYLLVRFTTELINAAAGMRGDASMVLVARRAAQKAVVLESGGWLIALCGVGCIVVGLIRTAPAVEEGW